MQNATSLATRITPEMTEALLAIAREAGEATMVVYTRLHNGTADDGWVKGKADGSPVTEADLRAHTIIVAQLAALTPQIPVVSEEDAASLAHRQPQGEFWLTDPLDGTKEFISGSHEFTVNIALIRDGAPVFGVVHAPALGQSYWGGAAQGSYRVRDGKTDSLTMPPPRGKNQPCRVIASKSHMSAETEAYIATLGACELVQAGSSLKFCRVAEGEADVYPRLGPTCEWDTAAAQAVVEGAGGKVVNMRGQPLRYGKPDVLNPSFVVSRK